MNGQNWKEQKVDHQSDPEIETSISSPEFVFHCTGGDVMINPSSVRRRGEDYSFDTFMFLELIPLTPFLGWGNAYKKNLSPLLK